MNLADRLKSARESINKSQKELADLLGTSFRSWQDYEAGKSVPGGKVFISLSKLGFNANWLLTGEGEMRRGDKPIMSDPGVHYTSSSKTNAQLDEEQLQAVLEAVEEYLDSIDSHLPSAKKAQLVAMLYEMCSESAEKKVDRAAVIRLVKLAA